MKIRPISLTALIQTLNITNFEHFFHENTSGSLIIHGCGIHPSQNLNNFRNTLKMNRFET